MKILKVTTLIILITISNVLCMAKPIQIILKDGSQQEMDVALNNIRSGGIVDDENQIIKYEQIKSLKTDDFDLYKRLSLKTNRPFSKHIKLDFTGDGNIYRMQIEDLQSRRTAAHVARAAGGVMYLIGVLADDRQLAAAGIATHGVGTISKDINDERMMMAQNQMLADMQDKQVAKPSEEEQYRKEYGSENVDAFLALLDNNMERALAFANIGETSKDANHRLTAIWLKAIIASEGSDAKAIEKEYERLVTFDPEVNNQEDAKKEVTIIMDEIKQLRKA